MHDSLTVANRFLELARKDRHALTPMQLLKLVYIAHGWKLGLTGRALIRDPVEAWQYGPVIPRLYDRLRTYKGAPVTDLLPAPVGDELGEEEMPLLEDVYERYGRLDGFDLSKLTHAPGSPWSQVYHDGAFGSVISNDRIQDYYEALSQAA
ncbi:Panacea domain-containing protein [Parvularcula dongshanensis]|uniref:Putative phage-associated protein n=1 Tax=Parvularcula dongshanensis TaxID=1173995 RepID=A0A840I2S1_9PROT|nr:type II toxin-antitoxin system antitoxin SocA domain-containing protein [Parvularcula dongshanensis]MBB4658350.1 putative phage-associated protein [Parvularcula dongshanensis]